MNQVSSLSLNTHQFTGMDLSAPGSESTGTIITGVSCDLDGFTHQAWLDLTPMERGILGTLIGISRRETGIRRDAGNWIPSTDEQVQGVFFLFAKPPNGHPLPWPCQDVGVVREKFALIYQAAQSIATESLALMDQRAPGDFDFQLLIDAQLKTPTHVAFMERGTNRAWLQYDCPAHEFGFTSLVALATFIQTVANALIHAVISPFQYRLCAQHQLTNGDRRILDLIEAHHVLVRQDNLMLLNLVDDSVADLARHYPDNPAIAHLAELAQEARNHHAKWLIVHT